MTFSVKNVSFCPNGPVKLKGVFVFFVKLKYVVLFLVSKVIWELRKMSHQNPRQAYSV